MALCYWPRLIIFTANLSPTSINSQSAKCWSESAKFELKKKMKCELAKNEPNPHSAMRTFGTN